MLQPKKYLPTLAILTTAFTATPIITQEPSASATVQYQSQIARRTAMYWCTSMSFGYCATPFAAANPGSAHMVCYRDGPDNGARWFFVFMPNGSEGFVYSNDVVNQTSTPNCATVNWVKATDFAYTHLGQVSDFADSYPGWDHYWSGACVVFVAIAWGGNVIPQLGPNSTAYSQWLNYNRLGAATTEKTYAPPRGAVVFFVLLPVTLVGHIAVSLGNWQFIGTTGLTGAGTATNAQDIRSTSGYLGWVFPTTPTAGSPYNPQGEVG